MHRTEKSKEVNADIKGHHLKPFRYFKKPLHNTALNYLAQTMQKRFKPKAAPKQ